MAAGFRGLLWAGRPRSEGGRSYLGGFLQIILGDFCVWRLVFSATHFLSTGYARFNYFSEKGTMDSGCPTPGGKL
jgi:hypothetical protein